MDADRRRLVEEICHEALNRAPHERGAYLDRACANDPDVRREVESLLLHEDAAERLLQSDVGAVAARVTGAEPELIGRRFGDYEITGKLGEGGMGQVFRARDRKLDRQVAIKILPEVFAADEERMRRFEREARLLATVNHRFIGAIYGRIDVDRRTALVLELVEGQTLSATLDKGALPLPRALAIAIQVSEALDHVHRRGITHRDLKPSNIMLTRDGVKLLDFGVGKRASAAGADSMTAPSTLTGAGAIVGTLHYMSPEQLEGRDVDARSDLFAFGAVLFEMLSGRKAFDGPSQASIIAAVIEAPRPRLPVGGGPHDARLDRILGKCLARDGDARWQSAKDLGDELQWLAADVASASTPAVGVVVARPAARQWWTAAAATLVLATSGFAAWSAPKWLAPAAEPPLLRFQIQPPETPYGHRGFDVSPDGTQIVFSDSFQTSRLDEGRGLWLKRFDQFEARLIPETAGASVPRFSPDGQWLVYVRNRTLRKLRTAGSEPSQMLTELNSGFHSLEWQQGDVILLGSAGRALRRINASDGSVIELQQDGTGVVDLHSPILLPGERDMLVAVHGPNNTFSIAAQAVNGSNRRTVVESGFQPVFLPGGYLVFGRDSTIMAAPFDTERLELAGPAVPVVEGIDGDPRSGIGEFRVSSSGTLVYVPQRPHSARTFVWVSARGERTPVAVPPGAIDSPSLSPDGAQLAYDAEQPSGLRQIWTHEFSTGKRAVLTRTEDDCYAPLWTKDGGLLYSKATRNGSDLMFQPRNGAAVKVGSSPNRVFALALLADDRTVLVSEQPPTDEYFLSQADLLRPGALTRFHVDPQSAVSLDTKRPRHGSVSPDRKWLAFGALEGNIIHTFIQTLPPSGAPRQVSVEGGREPRWSKDGKSLLFRARDRTFTVSVDTSRGLTWSAPRLLFESNALGTFIDYDTGSDGRVLTVERDPKESRPPQFNVVVNWLTELRARVASR